MSINNNKIIRVNGVKNICFYALESGKLFHVNEDGRNKIDEWKNNGVENKVITQLNDFGLQNYQEITEIEKKDLHVSFAWIEVTTRCNLKCIHCYEEACADVFQEMDENDFYRVIDELVNYGVPRIQLIGGEPLMIGKEKFLRFLTYASGKFELIEVFSNLTMLTEELVDYFSENNIRIATSIYSYNHSEHDKVTLVCGSHKKTESALAMLKEQGVQYRTANILMKNLEVHPCNTDLYRIRENKDVIRMSGRGNFSLLTPELIKKRLITKKTFSRKLSKPLVEMMMQGHNCFSKNLYIGADLTVYPCVMERRINHGSIKEKKLAEVVDEKLKRFNKDNIEGCKDCEFRYACFDCRPDSLDGNVYSKPWYCTYDPYTATWIDEDRFIEILNDKFAKKV